MRPKLYRWYVIAWLDAPCQVGLCLNVRRLEFLMPEGGRGGKVEELDTQDQVLHELGTRLIIPKLSDEWDGVRLKPMRNGMPGRPIKEHANNRHVLNARELKKYIKELQKKYPKKEFELLKIHENETPGLSITFSHKGTCIVNPLATESFFYKVDPKKYYKISNKDAEKIAQHNGF